MLLSFAAAARQGERLRLQGWHPALKLTVCRQLRFLDVYFLTLKPL